MKKARSKRAFSLPDQRRDPSVFAGRPFLPFNTLCLLCLEVETDPAAALTGHWAHQIC